MRKDLTGQLKNPANDAEGLPSLSPRQARDVTLSPQLLDNVILDDMVDQLTTLAKARNAPRQPSQLVFFPTMGEAILRNAGRNLLWGDMAALLFAFTLGGVIAWASNVFLMHDGFQQLLNNESIKQFMLFIGMGGAAILWLDQQGHYRQRLPYWEKVGHLVSVTAIGLLLSGFVQFAFKSDFSRLWLGLSWVLFGLLVFAFRIMVRRTLDKEGIWQVPVLLVGNGPTAEAAAAAVQSEQHMGYDIVAQIADEQVANLTQPRDWQRLLAEKGAGYILLALEGRALEESAESLRAAARARLPYLIVPPWIGLPCGGMTPHTFFTHDVVMLHNTNRLSLPLPRILKRSFDMPVAGSALLVLSPVFVAVALMTMRDGGPAFYTDKRVGHAGRVFGCYKFRSMLVNNDNILQKHLAENPAAAAEWAQYQKLAKDPRITAFGRFIRKTSIDELPQLLNVLKGDMSLVGPRPIMPGQEEFYGDDFTFYTAVRPGITGPWQVSGRNRLTFDKRVQLECWYARNWSLWMDIVILLKTFPTVLGKDSKAF